MIWTKKKINILLLLVGIFCPSDAFRDYVLRDLGCWKDTADRAIPSIDNRLQGQYQARPDAIQQCANAAKILGYTVFAVQNGGWCASGPNAQNTYKKYGMFNRCDQNGRGGPWANQVYEIDTVLKVNYKAVGCFKDREERAIPIIEGCFVDLRDTYTQRVDSIGKCARIAASLGNQVFSVQNGGQCASSAQGNTTYKKYGHADNCAQNGKGGAWANNVYEITGVAKISLTRFGCYEDKSERALPLLERPEVLPGSYPERPHAIEQCVRYASGFGYLFIGIQNGGQCLAGENYDRYGPSDACEEDSRGGPWANEVFQLSVEKQEMPPSTLRMQKYHHLHNLGCWADQEDRAIPASLEDDEILIGTYTSRNDAIQRCAEAAAWRGFNIIGVQNGGQCWSGANGRSTYRMYGTSTACSENGKGGGWANQVYEIDTIYDPVATSLNCYKDTATRAIQLLEGTQPSLTGDYQERTDSLQKCAIAAAGHGYRVFGLQNGGQCVSSADAESRYMIYGRADNCGNGLGGPWANSVYKILDNVEFYIEDQGCWADDAYRTIPPDESENPDSEYWTREDALAKCARHAHSRGFQYFALQNGGWCATSADAGITYKRIGPSHSCNMNGKGGPWSNRVFSIVRLDLGRII